MKANHKTAFLCVESTVYKYIEDLSAPKEWFIANVNRILKVYADNHSVTKEDIFLGRKSNVWLSFYLIVFLTVTGTLSAPDYALFVGHNHPDGQVRARERIRCLYRRRSKLPDQVHFEVSSPPQNGQPWGKFSLSANMSSPMLGGHCYEEESAVPFSYKGKVSTTSGGEWHSLLLARLRFKPDMPDPTAD